MQEASADSLAASGWADSPNEEIAGLAQLCVEFGTKFASCIRLSISCGRSNDYLNEEIGRVQSHHQQTVSQRHPNLHDPVERASLEQSSGRAAASGVATIHRFRDEWK
jgi:hypothetical protein